MFSQINTPLPTSSLRSSFKSYIGRVPFLTATVLLVLFIKAENHTLSMSQIMADVWPGKSISPDCFHKAIERLRDLLRQLPMTIQIEYLGEEIYQMQIL